MTSIGKVGSGKGLLERARSVPAAACRPLRLLVGGVFVAEAGLTAGHGDFVAVDENHSYGGFYVEGVAAGNHHVGGFARVERAELVGDTPDFGGVEGDGFEGLVVGKTEARGETGRVGQIAGVVRVVGGDDDLDAALVELSGEAVDGVEALFGFGSFIDRTDDDGNFERGDVIENRLGVADVVEDEF